MLVVRNELGTINIDVSGWEEKVFRRDSELRLCLQPCRLLWVVYVYLHSVRGVGRTGCYRKCILEFVYNIGSAIVVHNQTLPAPLPGTSDPDTGWTWRSGLFLHFYRTKVHMSISSGCPYIVHAMCLAGTLWWNGSVLCLSRGLETPSEL